MRRKFESISQHAPSPVPQQQSRQSRRDSKPKASTATEAPPAPVVAAEPEDELPPSGYSRNMAAKFRELEQQTPDPSSGDRPPVRQLSPPPALEAEEEEVQAVQNEPEREVVRSDNASIRDGEMPAPGLSRNMLQVFRTLETSNVSDAVAPSPAAAQKKQKARTQRTVTSPPRSEVCV